MLKNLDQYFSLVSMSVFKLANIIDQRIKTDVLGDGEKLRKFFTLSNMAEGSDVMEIVERLRYFMEDILDEDSQKIIVDDEILCFLRVTCNANRLVRLFERYKSHTERFSGIAPAARCSLEV